jgi:hypothetical protein
MHEAHLEGKAFIKQRRKVSISWFSRSIVRRIVGDRMMTFVNERRQEKIVPSKVNW